MFPVRGAVKSLRTGGKGIFASIRNEGNMVSLAEKIAQKNSMKFTGFIVYLLLKSHKIV